MEETPHFKPRNLLGVLAFLGKYPGRVALSVSMLLSVIAIEMVQPRMLGHAINALGGQGFQPWHFAAIFFALVVAKEVIRFLLGPVRNGLIHRTLNDIRAAIYDALQRLAFTYHDRTNTGELISRSTSDISRLQTFLFACLFLTIDILVCLAATVTLIFLASPAIGWATVATMVPTVGLLMLFAKKLQPQWRMVHDLHGDMTTVIQENIAGVRVVKAFAREADEVVKFRARRDAYLGRLLYAVDYWVTRVPLAQFIFGLSMPLALWIGGGEVIAGRMRVGDLAAVVFYLMAMSYRVGAVGQFAEILQNASASAERVMEVIEAPRDIRGGAQPLPAGRGEVRFENVSFAYREGRASLTDVSFTARPGQTVAVVGPTGSGKSTLVHLIPRFYESSGGRVLVEGVDVRDLNLLELRRNVGVIFQETFLFSASVADNIAYGRPGAAREEIERCARAAQAHEFILELPKGYDTVIGERGVSLSGGQRQRVAIARAFILDPRILILDDATASVDSKTERLIREAMRKLCEGRTTFVIAHRFSTVQHADQILVLKEGRIAESGRHDELIRRSGFYAEIFNQQIQMD